MNAGSPKGKPKRAWILALSMVGVVAVASFAYWLTIPPTPAPVASDPSPAPPPAILKFERDGFRFTYHVPTRYESLYEVAKDPDCLTNLASEMPERTSAMRRQLEHDIGVESLRELERDFQEHIDKLRALGYL